MRYLFIIVTSIVLVACAGNKSEKAIADIKLLEANPSLSTSDTLINSYLNFSTVYPDHELTAMFMFKAAQAYVKSNRVLKGVRLYEQMAMKYEKDTLAAEALIRGGVGFQSLQDPANAKRLYDLFVQKYPQHPRVNEVRLMSEYVGLSDEELLRRFNEKILKTIDSAQSK